MADIVSEERRSQIMSRIRSKNTKPEIMVRSILHAAGFRFTVNGPRNRTLPGKPDIVMPAWKTVVFVHGCFWHGHQGCKNFRIPKTRSSWWEEKIRRNKQRDNECKKELEKAGWRVVVIWECSLQYLASMTNREIRELVIAESEIIATGASFLELI